MLSSSAIESSKNNDMLTRSYSDRSYDRNRNATSKQQRDYDGLKKQCDNAIHELIMLRRQYGIIVQQYDQTVKELEHFRGKNELINQVKAAQESSSLCVYLAPEKQTLNTSQQNTEDDTASFDSPNDHSMRYDSRIKYFEVLRKRYEDLHTIYSAAVDNMNMMKDETNQLKKQCNEIFQERDIALRHRDGFKLQCTAVINRWNLTLRDRNALQKVLQMVQQQHEEAVKEIKVAVDFSVEISKKLKDLNKAHNAVVQEYRLIMSERDSVHNEIEKLSEDLSQAHNKNKSLQNKLKSCKDEKKTLQLHIESLKHDKIMLECESIRNLRETLRKQRNDDMSKLERDDCDDLMNQKCETTKELNNFKEKLETQLEDAALQDRDTEILNIDLDVRQNEDLGIDLLGGRDNPLYINDNAIYISSVNKKSVAARNLRVNDCILKVNSLDCSSISKQLVLETMRSLGSATLVIRRRKPAFPSGSFFTTQFQVNNFDHGISLETGIYINKITPGSLAAKDGNLDVGDRVLSINNTEIYNIKNPREAMLLLHESCDVTITTMKSTYCAGNCGSRPNREIYKKYVNNSTQTEKYSFSTYQKSYQKPQNVQSTMMLEVPGTSYRNPSPVNNSISEQNQEDAFAEFECMVDDFIPQPAAPTTTKNSNRSGKSAEFNQNLEVSL